MIRDRRQKLRAAVPDEPDLLWTKEKVALGNSYANYLSEIHQKDIEN